MQNPLNSLEAIATNAIWSDPAICADQSDGESIAEHVVKYRRTRDLKDLVLKEGHTPTLFVLKPIPAKALAGLLSASLGPTFRAALAFLYSCHLVKLPDGQLLEPSEYEAGANGLKLAKDDWLEKIRDEFGYETVQEMGGVALQRAQLPARAKGPFTYRGGSGPVG